MLYIFYNIYCYISYCIYKRYCSVQRWHYEKPTCRYKPKECSSVRLEFLTCVANGIHKSLTHFFSLCQGWQPPFACDVDRLHFTPRIQRLNELEVRQNFVFADMFMWPY